MNTHYPVFHALRFARAASVVATVLFLGASKASSATMFPLQCTNADISYGPHAEGVTGAFCIMSGSRITAMESGVVVGHPKVMLTCAHSVFKNGVWVPISTFRFTPAHNTFAPPTTGLTFRGYYRFASYSTMARSKGRNSKEALNLDLYAGYSHSNLAGGRCAGYWTSGAATVLKSSSYWKKITGYPWTKTVSSYMHRIGPINASCTQVYGGYYQMHGAATWPGNSGGPVFGYDQAGLQWYLAGIQVTSDGATRLGVRALDAGGLNLLQTAVAAANR